MAGWEISEQATEVYSWENHGTRWVERNSNVYIVTREYEQAKCGFHEPKCGKTNMLWVFMCVWCFMSSNMRFGPSPAPQGFFIVGPSPIPKPLVEGKVRSKTYMVLA
jgi:hypothetical protein